MPGGFVAASSQRINLGLNQDYCRNCSGNTMMAWIYVTDLSVERDIISISVSGSSATTTSRASLLVTASGQLQVIGRATDADAEHDGIGTAGAIVVNTWYHVVGVNDLVNQTQTLYINGSQHYQATGVTFNAGVTANTASYNAHIGAQDDGGSAYMSGYIHDLRIYSRVLTANEIKTIYTSGGKDSIIYMMDGRFLMSEGAVGSTISSVPNLGTIRTAGTPVNSPTYVASVIESV